MRSGFWVKELPIAHLAFHVFGAPRAQRNGAPVRIALRWAVGYAIYQAITAHAYPPPVWPPGEVEVDYVQISAANLAAGSYAVWMGMYSPFTQVRATVAVETFVVSEDRARRLEF